MPKELTVKLPATGTYYVSLSNSLYWWQRFYGDYCLTVFGVDGAGASVYPFPKSVFNFLSKAKSGKP